MPKETRAHLIEERKCRQWSQQELANRLGTTRNNVGRWELGQTTPGPYFRTKLCELFGKSVQELGLLGEPTVERQQQRTHTHSPLPGTPKISSPIVAQSDPLWHVPYPRNPHFTGRDELLEQLTQLLSSEELGDSAITRRAALTQPQAIKGLGGIGKTQIAVEYAYRAREQDRYTYILWINAASEEAIMTSLVTLVEVLPTFPAKDETDQHKLVAAIKRWLEQCQQPWLLIFDNADDLSFIQKYLPYQGHGSILLTTRANAVAAITASIEVEQMGLIEGTQLLLHRARRLYSADDERNEATNVVIALDGFPLALDQAGAYIEETGCSFREYLQLYHDHRAVLLARRGTQATYYPDSVVTTWLLSFQKVEQANPAAAELLRLCAFLAPDHIPEELLKDGAAYWPPLLQQAVTDLFAFNQMIEELLKFSLLRRLVEDHMLCIHRLVQVVQMDRMKPEEQRQWVKRIVRAVNTVFPQNPKEEISSRPRCLRYLEQAQACDALIQQHLILLPEAADLLERTGIYLREHASYTLAEPLFQQVLRQREQRLGPEHPDVAHVINNLAILYSNQGKYEQAEPLYQRALQIREQHLGPEHLDVTNALNGLGLLYYNQGKYEQAEPLYQRALQIRERHLGLEHFLVAHPLNNLALLYYDQGEYERAEPLYQRALWILEQHLGPEHPDIAAPLNGLARLYYDQGKYERAEPLYQRALWILERHLGPEHPRVTYALAGLASLYQEQGKNEEAESLYQRALWILEQRVEPEHPMKLYPLDGLASLYSEQGKHEQAERLFRRSLCIREHLGPEHFQMAYPLTGLANLYSDQKKYAEAERLFQQALSIREKALDPYHPRIADTLHGFAALYAAQGNLQAAASLYQRALAIRKHVYGSQHFKTTQIRERLCAVLRTLGQIELATQLEEVETKGENGQTS